MGSIVVNQQNFIGTGKEIRVYTKGAPDMLLDKVKYCIGKDGTTKSIDSEI
jgi:hypothetical protein